MLIHEDNFRLLSVPETVPDARSYIEHKFSTSVSSMYFAGSDCKVSLCFAQSRRIPTERPQPNQYSQPQLNSGKYWERPLPCTTEVVPYASFVNGMKLTQYLQNLPSCYRRFYILEYKDGRFHTHGSSGQQKPQSHQGMQNPKP